MRRLLSFALLAISFTAGAVVIRSDVDDAEYRVEASVFPALVDMPGEGHGVLIAPRWVVTAAHAAPMQGMEVSIAGVPREVERVVTYPGYTKLPGHLVEEALASGDLSEVHAFLASSNDIALVELASPVTGVAPVPLYRGNEEVGMTVQLVGKGATGNGTEGQVPHSSRRTVLRRAFNVIAGTDARYVWYRFDPAPSGLPLEGITGSGDSGGPLLIGNGSLRQLIGLTSWGKYPAGHPFLREYAPDRPFQEGLYGQLVYGVRISSYVQWIEGVMSAATGAGTQLQPAEARTPSSGRATRTTSTREWVRYSSELCPFEASFPTDVSARSIGIAGKEFAHEFEAGAGRNSVLIRCTATDDPAEYSDARLLAVAGWNITDPTIQLQETSVDGWRALKVVKHYDPISLHRVFFVAGRYHYRLDFNERESAPEDIERFFSSVALPTR